MSLYLIRNHLIAENKLLTNKKTTKMIQRKITLFQNSKDSKVEVDCKINIFFGFGTVSIPSGIAKVDSNKFPYIGFEEIPKQEVGSPVQITDNEDPVVKLTFTNKEGFDVFYSIVEKIKEQFNEQENEKTNP